MGEQGQQGEQGEQQEFAEQDATAQEDRRREVLRQAEVALGGRVVTLWEISPNLKPIALASSRSSSGRDPELDLEETLMRWGLPIIPGSRWAACLLEGRWCVAPVRTAPAAPPPGGVERRTRERLILEVAGLAIGLIDATAAVGQRRLPPTEAMWELARQPSVIAHEVGNPLAVALGSVELSLRTIRTLPGLEESIRAELLQDLANVMEGIEQASGYLRAIQERPVGQPLRPARFDAVPIVRSCVTLEGPLARKRGVQLKLQTSLESVFIFGDSGSLYQIATNLIRNGTEAMDGKEGPVTVTLEQIGSSLRLSVSDQGRGIPADHLPRLFEAGFTTKPGAGGGGAGTSGMGLTVVRAVTEKVFGGRVDVHSVVGRGTTFTVTLPIPPQRRGAFGRT